MTERQLVVIILKTKQMKIITSAREIAQAILAAMKGK